MSQFFEVNPETLNAIDQMMSNHVSPEGPGAALAVSLKGEVVFAKARGLANIADTLPLSIHSALDAGSVMKTLTGLAIALLEDDGALSSETKLKDILPEFPVYGADLQLKHLIHHESGLRNYTVLLYYMAGWHEQAPPSSERVLEAIYRAGSLSFRPGAKYEYCDSNYFLLARAIELVTGERLGSLIDERILRPMRMNESVILDHANPQTQGWAEGYVGYPSKLRSPYDYREAASCRGFYPARLAYSHVGAEGLRTSVCDLLTLGRHLVGPSEVIPASVRDRMLHVERMREDGFSYGYGLNVGTFRGLRFFGHSGEIQGFTATLACFPEQELLIASLTNRQDLAAWACRNWVLDGLLGKSTAPQRSEEDSRPKAADLEEELLGFYLNPISAGFLELVNTVDGPGVSLNGDPVQTLFGTGPWQTAQGVRVVRQDVEGCCRSSLIVRVGYVASEYIPFSAHATRADALAEYAGTYTCELLDSTFLVEATDDGIRLTNVNTQHPSMNLDYTPTIRDFFWSYDPHPGISQLQFLRDVDHIHAFVYRDYDGDHREDFVFVRDSAFAI